MMLAQFAATGSVLPFVTMLFRERGLSYAQISLLLTLSAAAMTVCPLLWGMAADRWISLNRVFSVVNAASAALLGLMVLGRGFALTAAAFTLYSACALPTFTLINALAFHHLPHPREQFGRLRAFGSLGWILPFLPISLWTARRPGAGLDFTLWLGAGLSLVSAAWAFALPPTRPGAARRGPGPNLYGRALKRLLGNSDFTALLLSMFLVAGAFSILLYYSPPYLEKLGVPRPWIGPIQALGVVVEIGLFQWHGRLARAVRPTVLILAGSSALILRHLLYAFCGAPLWLSLSYALAAAVIVFHHTGVSLLSNALAGGELRATSQTLLSFAGQGLGPMFAHWLAGRIAVRFGDDLRPIFLAAALLCAAAFVIILSRRRSLDRPSSLGEQTAAGAAR